MNEVERIKLRDYIFKVIKKSNIKEIHLKYLYVLIASK